MALHALDRRTAPVPWERLMRLLTVMGRLPYPADTGGKIRSSKLFERLAKRHDITIVSFRTSRDADEQVRRMTACCSRLITIDWEEIPKRGPAFYASVARSVLSTRAYTVAKYADERMRQAVVSLLAREHYDALVCDFLQPSVNVLDVGSVPKILFQHNVESVIRHRQAEQTRNPLARAYLYWDWRKLRAFERAAALRFDHCIMVSAEDCRTMAREFGVTTTSAIPTAVDVEYFTPRPDAMTNDVVFTGSMDWFANEDAVLHFARAILPRVRQQVDATFWVVGRNPPEALRRAIEGIAGVRVTGTVDDVRPYIERAAVYVVPLRIGGGTRIKIFEAMAMGKAIVSTSVGAEGLPVSDGADIVLADDPERFAAAVVTLVRNQAERHRVGRAARKLAEQHDWNTAATCFSDTCAAVVDRWRGAACA
jgi:sugar transferase (PEP-CTERM/EpsH1 system associated)